MYIGNSAQNQGFTPAVDFFSGNASTTAFTLSRPVASVYQMIVSVANVIQNPGSAYTVTGNTITFSSAPPSGTNNIWVEYTSLITQIIAPSPGTVGTSQLQSNLALTGATNSGQWTAANMPTGSVIQVVTNSITSSTTTNSSTYVATNLTASITPQFSSSKVLILISASLLAGGSGNTLFASIFRNSTNLASSAGYNAMVNMAAGAGATSNSGLFCNQNISYLDSPSTTSSTTYTLEIYSYLGGTGNNVQFDPNGVGSTITLLEIR